MHCRHIPPVPNPAPSAAEGESIAGDLRCLSGPWVEPCPNGSGRLLLTKDGEHALQLAAILAFGGPVADINDALRRRGIDHLVSADLRINV